MKILTFEETSIIINKFEELADESKKDSILKSNIVYSNTIDVGFSECSLTIYNYNDYLYIRTIIDEVDDLEPLLIQVEDDGTIIDFILLDFVIRFKEILNLEDYFILQSDYTFVMDRIRFIK